MTEQPNLLSDFAVIREVFGSWSLRIATAMVACLSVGLLAGYRINVSDSLPVGIYKTVAGSAPIERGSIVVVCLPREWAQLALRRQILGRGRCEGGTYGLGKTVLALSSDVVEIRASGVYVNGEFIPNSERLKTDRFGRPVPNYPFGVYKILENEVWLHSYHPQAFDSRYFGPISRIQIQSVVRPVWTRAAQFLE